MAADLRNHRAGWCGPDSRLRYDTSFGRQLRPVYLTGEATFTVTRDSQKPFLVHTGDVVTKVVGTQFSVRAVDGESRVRVQVLSGQVSVYQAPNGSAANRPRGVMLLPNQQVVFDRTTDRFDKTLVDTPLPLKPLTGPKNVPAFVYNDTPITQVLQDIEAAYGITIRYNTEALAGCQLNSVMTHESFEQKLRIVCATIGATYEIIDGQVIISGGGCQSSRK